jgi:site-specific recombinase XerD
MEGNTGMTTRVLFEALEVYEVTVSNLSADTKAWYHSKLAIFADWCKGQDIDLPDITPKVVLTFLEYVKTRVNPRSKKLVTSDTHHGYIKVIRQFLTWCSNDEDYGQYVSKKTIKRIVLPKVEQKVIETFTTAEINAFFDAADKSNMAKRDRAILSLLLDTGIRASELCGLTIENVHIGRDDAYIKVMGKGRKEREVSLGSKSRISLLRYLRADRKDAKSSDPVFLTQRDEPLNRNTLNQLLYRLRDDAKIKTRVSAHKWRHTFATR